MIYHHDHDPTLSLHWRHNDHDGDSNHQPHGCLLSRLFRRRSKKTSKLCFTGLCVGNSPVPVNSPHKGPVTRKMFPFDHVIMVSNCNNLKNTTNQMNSSKIDWYTSRNWFKIASDHGLLPIRRQTIISANTAVLLIVTPGINVGYIWIKIGRFS